MGFLKPSVPKPDPAANTPIQANSNNPLSNTTQSQAAASLISTSGQGLTRRAATQRASLIGGA